ncbi:MAG: Fic family protein [Bacteriovoracaceae bacterium]|nr:Fic family protein [Bacteriovoracaceae bacterium]
MKNFMALLLILAVVASCSKSNPQYFVAGDENQKREIASEVVDQGCVELISKVGFPTTEELNAAKTFRATAEHEKLLDRVYGYVDPLTGHEVRSIETMKKDWRKYEPKIYWKMWREDAHYRRFINVHSVARAEGITHPVEMYGANVYKAWKKADDYLTRIPKGEFKLDRDIIKEVNRITTVPLYAGSVKSKIFPDGYVAKAGTFKKRTNYADAGIKTSALSEDVYQNLINNKNLSGFVEMPWSKEGKRVGMIKYAGGDEMLSKLDELLTWLEKSKKSIDPIELAARFQYRFVSIHPLMDGNGRTSRLLMDRILMEFDLPPPIIKNMDDDIYYSEDAWVAKVYKGVERALIYAKDALDNRSTTKTLGDAPAVFDLNMKDTPFNRLDDLQLPEELIKYKKMVNTELFPKGNSEITMGGERFIMMADGFFYNHRGVPYAVHDGELYPIAEKTYMLYEEMGAYNAKLELRRAINPEHEAMYIEHLKVIKGLKEGSVRPGDFKLRAYDEIKAANNAGEIHLFPWQKGLFKHAININTDNAFAVLSTTRGGITNFERNFVKGHKLSPGLILAQYEWMDLKFWEYLAFAKKHSPDMLDDINKSRRKLHEAGRELLGSYLTDRSNLSSDAQKVYSYNPKVRLWDMYFAKSKLSEPDFDSASRKFNDKYQYIIRSDYQLPRYVGFLHQGSLKSTVKSMGGEKLVKYFNELAKEWSQIKINHMKNIGKSYRGKRALTRESLYEALTPELKSKHKLIYGLFGKKIDKFDYMQAKVISALDSKYTHRGAAEEFERIYVSHVLHMTDYTTNQMGTSWSLNPDLYINNAGKIPFVQKGFETNMYIAKVKKTEVSRNFSSKYFRQYEVIANGDLVKPWNIKSHITGTELMDWKTENIDPAIMKEVTTLLKNSSIQPPKSGDVVQ